jgi:BASS family bile acid:Na+ symporter
MELVKQLVPMLLTLSLGLMMVSAAMESSKGQFAYVLRRPKLLLKAILAVNIIPLIGAMIVVGLFPSLSQPSRAAILIMAISPVPPLVPGKALKFGGRREYVYGLQLAMAVVALFAVPILGKLVAAHYDAEAVFPVRVVAMNVLTGLAFPVLVGVALGRWLAPGFSRRNARLVGVIAAILLVIALVPILIAAAPKMVVLTGDGTLLACAIVVAIALLGGHLLGEKDLGDKSTLAFAAAMRHPGIALALIGANHANRAIVAAVLLFLLVGLVVMIPYQLYIRRAMKAASVQTVA